MLSNVFHSPIQCAFAFLLIVAGSGKTHSANICSLGYYGRGCIYRCQCAGGIRCDPTSGRCPRGCLPGWSGTSCQTENVALGKLAKQRTTFRYNTADKALDWSVGTETCAMTRPGSPGSWKVDLQQNYVLHRMYLKSAAGENLKGVRVYVSETGDLVSSVLCGVVSLYADHSELVCEVPLTGQFVHVVNTESQLILCDVQIYVCSDFRFGILDCEGICHCRKGEEVCNKTYGTCESGCEEGWGGENCQKGCNRTFGSGCKQQCGYCRGREPCDPRYGACVGGCGPGWRGSTCKHACIPGSYGRGCSSMCGHCLHTSCHPVTGRCPRGCEAGWMGARCDSTCPDDRYGENCAFQCGKCRSGTSCNRETGICSQGCSDGWRGVFCTLECRDGTYGTDCAHTCENCKSGTCNTTNGLCGPSGCKVGWSGPKCDRKCARGMFGKSCQLECGHCRNGETCEAQTGACSSGCASGWTGPLCKDVCQGGFYGEDCEISCGVCMERAPCHHVTGKCAGECAHGYSGPLCEKKLLIDPTRNLLTSVVLGIGAVMFGTLVAFIVCLVTRWRQDDIQDDGEEDEKRTERRAPLLKRLNSAET